MELPEIKERLLEFIKTMGLSVAQFERRAGLSNGYIRNFRGSFGGNKFDMILEAFPMLNREWVTTGRGEMMLPRESAEAIDEVEDDVEATTSDSEATEVTEVKEGGRKIVFNVSKEQLDAYARLAADVMTDWRTLYENSQREVTTLRMLLEVSQQQFTKTQSQLDAALEQIKVMQEYIASNCKQ